jgi:hypothetical protein
MIGYEPRRSDLEPSSLFIIIIIYHESASHDIRRAAVCATGAMGTATYPIRSSRYRRSTSSVSCDYRYHHCTIVRRWSCHFPSIPRSHRHHLFR